MRPDGGGKTNHLPSAAGSKPKVLILLREGSADLRFMLSGEVGVMVSMVEAAGLEAVTASPSGRRMGQGFWKIKPDLKLADVALTDFVGLLLPSMAVGLTAPIPPQLIEIVRRAVAGKVPLAAQHGSVVVLQRAGVLRKKKYAFERRVFKEGIYAGSEVVQDGNIITSATCPYRARETGRADGTAMLTRLLIETVTLRGHSSTRCGASF
jgi:putative intracellular protease/amidase